MNLDIYVYYTNFKLKKCGFTCSRLNLRGKVGDNFPTNLFPILEPRDQEIDELYVVQDRRATDFEATKL